MNRPIRQWTKRVLLQVQRSTALHHHRISIPLSFDHDEQNKNKPFLLSVTAAGLKVDPTVTATAVETSLPVVLAMNETILKTIYETGLPWWATIVAGTLVLRTSLTLPTAIYQQRSLGKMINLAPMVQSWAETLKVQVANESKLADWPYKKYQAELQKQYSEKVKSIYAHYGCARWKLLLLPWIQIPLFVSMSLTLRHMTALPLPWYGQTAETAALGLSEGGLAWFTDLTAADPTMVIPVMIGAGNLINVELNAWHAKGRQLTSREKVMTNAFRVLSVAFIPIAAHTPISIGLYWFASAWYSVAQNIIFKIPSVRTVLKLPLIQKIPQKSIENK